MRELLSILNALSDLNRVRIVGALSERGELCVCQLQELLSLAPSTTSKHLSLLAGAGLLAMRKQGRWAYYRLAEENDMPRHAADVVRWVLRESAQESQFQQDRQRLDSILSLTPEELCQLQAIGQRCCSCAPETPAEAKWPKATPAH